MKTRIDNITKWIRNQVPEGGKVIIGISGGKDSTIAAALCVHAVGAKNVIGVLMPNGRQSDIDDSYRVCNHLHITHHTVNVGEAYCSLLNELFDSVPSAYPAPDVITTNLPARLRMATLYAVAALYPNSRVVNTSNWSERYIGYSTKYGDGAGDFSPLGMLTVSEILAIGDDLGLPYDLVHKTPTDGMSGKSDEEKIGFTYEELDNYLLIENMTPSREVLAKITKMHEANKHKLLPMPMFNPNEEE